MFFSNLGLADVESVEQGQVLHHEVEAGLGELCVGDVEDLEVPELGEGDHHAELVAVHEGRVGHVQQPQVLQGPLAQAAAEKYLCDKIKIFSKQDRKYLLRTILSLYLIKSVTVALVRPRVSSSTIL